MPIPVSCACGKHFNAPDSAAGKTGKCPGCGAAIKVPTHQPDTQDGAFLSTDPMNVAAEPNQRAMEILQEREAQAQADKRFLIKLGAAVLLAAVCSGAYYWSRKRVPTVQVNQIMPALDKEQETSTKEIPQEPSPKPAPTFKPFVYSEIMKEVPEVFTGNMQTVESIDKSKPTLFILNNKTERTSEILLSLEGKREDIRKLEFLFPMRNLSKEEVAERLLALLMILRNLGLPKEKVSEAFTAATSGKEMPIVAAGVNGKLKTIKGYVSLDATLEPIKESAQQPPVQSAEATPPAPPANGPVTKDSILGLWRSVASADSSYEFLLHVQKDNVLTAITIYGTDNIKRNELRWDLEGDQQPWTFTSRTSDGQLDGVSIIQFNGPDRFVRGTERTGKYPPFSIGTADRRTEFVRLVKPLDEVLEDLAKPKQKQNEEVKAEWRIEQARAILRSLQALKPGTEAYAMLLDDAKVHAKFIVNECPTSSYVEEAKKILAMK